MIELDKDVRIATLESTISALTTNHTITALTATNAISALTATIALHVAFHAFVQRELRNGNVEIAKTVLDCLVTKSMAETAELIRVKLMEREQKK